MPRLNPRLSTHAKAMRREPTEYEKHLWRHLSGSLLGGYKFRRQAVIGNRIADFFCPSVGLIVEVDGDTHDRESDVLRDAALEQFGLSVLRVSNADVSTNMEGVLMAILDKLHGLPDRVSWRLPHPNPSPEGEGLEGAET